MMMKSNEIITVVVLICALLFGCGGSDIEPRVASPGESLPMADVLSDPYPLPITDRLSDPYPFPIAEDPSLVERLTHQRDELLYALQNDNLTDQERILMEARIDELRMMIDRLDNHPTRTAGEVHELIDLATRAAEHTPPPPPTPVLGILPEDSLPLLFIISSVRPESAWQGYVANVRTLVYAGRLWPDNNHSTQELTYHGAVLVLLFEDDEPRSMVLYQTEEETGALTIIEATENGLLTLESAGYGELDSQLFLFNSETRELALAGP